MARKRKHKGAGKKAGVREREITASASPASPMTPSGAGTREEEECDQGAASHEKTHHAEVLTVETSTPREGVPDGTAAQHAGLREPAERDERAGQLTTAADKDKKSIAGADDSASPSPVAEPGCVASRDPEGEGLSGEGSHCPIGDADSGASVPTTNHRSETTTQIIIIGVALLLFVVVLSRNFLPVEDNAHRAQKNVSPNNSVCRTSACTEYSRRLQHSLSTKANPCYNFYRYVCDSWSDSSGGIPSMTSERLKTHVLRSWIDGDAMALGRVGEMTLLATSLFRSCVSGNSLRSVSSDGVAELLELMDQRGLKWPNASASTPPTRDLLEMLVDWTLNWNVDVWFSLRVILADTPRHRFTFHVRHSAALQRWSKERAVLEAAEQHVAFVTAYAREFGTSNAEGFDRAVQDVLETEPEIEKFLTDYTPERELAGDGSNQKKIETDPERWRSAVHRSLGPSAPNVSTGDIALISSQGLIAAVAILLSRDAKREKYYSSIGWAVARELGRLVSGSLRQFHGMASTDLLLWCWDRMDKLTSSALVAPFYRSTPLSRAAALSRELFDTFRNSVSLALSENSWMDNRTKQIASSKIATLSLAFGFAKGTVPHIPRVDQPSKSNGNETLFRAWKRATTTYQSLSLEAKASLHSYELLMSNAFFHGGTATVRLQPALLQMPLYADTLPVILQYAGLGYVLVHQMMRALSDIFPLLEEDLRDPNLRSHPSNQDSSAARTYGAATDCAALATVPAARDRGTQNRMSARAKRSTLLRGTVPFS
ncbi:neprilysin-1-like isoform X2 [Dermacentor albipictus]|uniref:neprilysin-1-like isoform X2 n=1 Tax=Dermacentor albipictus TaxID=60249 RepID=UPI0038FCA005